jgi:cytochrome b561
MHGSSPSSLDLPFDYPDRRTGAIICTADVRRDEMLCMIEAVKIAPDTTGACTMPMRNSATSFGTVARVFHWLTAVVILTAIPLGLIANGLSAGPESIALKAQLFSSHKTLGIVAFFLGAARILWAFGQPRPVPLHPERRQETFMAESAHWLLYPSLVIVPLSGWVHHAAVDGFAPILWPFGQGLPFVPKSETVASMAGMAHWLFTTILAAAILLHVLGAVKHHLIDRDATMRRMARGVSALEVAAPHRTRLALLVLALGIYSAGAAVAVTMTTTPAPPTWPPLQAPVPNPGNWQVQTGSLGFGVTQMGAPVEGSFAGWTAEITFDDSIIDGPAGSIEVVVDMA